MFNAIGAVATRRPWLVIFVWVVAAVALTLVGKAKLYDVTTNDTSSFLPASYESAKAVKFGEAHFGQVKGATNVTGLVERTDQQVLTATDKANAAAVVEGMTAWRADWERVKKESGALFISKKEKETRALDPRVGPVTGGGRSELVSLQFKGNAADPVALEAFRQFRSHTIDAFEAKDLQIGFTGGIAEQADIAEATSTDKQIEQLLLFGAIVVLSLLFFRGVLSSVLPLLLVFLVAGAAVGVVVLAAMLFGFHLDATLPGLISTVLIGIGIDYFLFMVFRFRERLRLGEPRKVAAHDTAARVSPVVASAALAIVVAFAALGLADFGQFQVLGPAVAISVFVMLLAGITLVPALLAATGKKLFWPSKSWQRPREDGPAARLGALVARRPARVALASTGVLAVLAVAAVGVKMSYDLGSPPKSTKSAQVQAQIARFLPEGVTDEQQIYISSRQPLTAAELQPMRERLAGVENVGQVSQPRFADGNRAAEVDVALTIDSTTSEALELAGADGPLRTAAHTSVPDGATAMVAGNASIFADISESVNKDLKLIFPIASVLILLILFLMLRSLVAPIYLLLAVGLEFAATLGAAVLVYQQGLGHEGVIFTLPLVLFLFVVAIGTDYNILMSARLREELEDGASPREATARAVARVAPAITAAGLVLAASFASLMLNYDANTKQIGFGMAVGILIASFVVSTLLVPAITTLVGRKAWWPRGRERVSPDQLPTAERELPLRKAA
jgi:putative drug exporter of the RND superfamily